MNEVKFLNQDENKNEKWFYLQPIVQLEVSWSSSIKIITHSQKTAPIIMPYKGFIVANPLGQAINGQVLLLDFQISNFIQKDWKENSTPQ